jgi:hypothetical protein
MSVNEILDALDTLSAVELDAVREKIEAMRIGITPEEAAAIEEGLRSSREEPHCTIEDLREELRSWGSGSK